MIIAKTEICSPVFEQQQTKFIPTIRLKAPKAESNTNYRNWIDNWFANHDIALLKSNYEKQCTPVADFSQEIVPERKILHVKMDEESSGLTMDDVQAAIDRFRQQWIKSPVMLP